MSEKTTAQVLVEFRNELIKGGFPEINANEMARDAAARIVQSGGLQTQSVE